MKSRTSVDAIIEVWGIVVLLLAIGMFVALLGDGLAALAGWIKVGLGVGLLVAGIASVLARSWAPLAMGGSLVLVLGAAAGLAASPLSPVSTPETARAESPNDPPLVRVHKKVLGGLLGD